MPALTNPRHELFASRLAEGKTADDAYKLAGYKPNRGNASTLKTNQSILERVAELQAEAARKTSLTLENLLTMAQDTYARATAAGQHGAANSSLTLIARLLGLLVDRSEDLVEREKLQAEREYRAKMAEAGDLLAEAAKSLGVPVKADRGETARAVMIAARQQPFLPPAVHRLLNASEADHGHA